MKNDKKLYVAGNWLRGYFEGEFSSIDEAWSYLSKRFLSSYPSKSGRHICMSVLEKNRFGIEQLICCKEGELTEFNDLDENEVLERCTPSIYKSI